MSHQVRYRIASLLLVLTVLVSLGISQVPTSIVTAQTTNQVFLPLITKPIPPRGGVFGVELGYGAAPANLPQIQQAHISWVRYNVVLWSNVEPTPGARNWSTIAFAENESASLAAAGATPIVTVRSTPEWARKYSDARGTLCSPIREDALDKFATFMGELVARNPSVRYWELWNEPDIDPAIIDGESAFGCWGDQNDDYYGGGYYAEMLKRVYPAIKRANPAAQVVLGGLLLNCDPSHTYAPARDCKPGKFLEGILRNGGGSAFDVLGYHGYPIWSQANVDWELVFDTWMHRGGVVLGKLDFLRSVMSQYSVSKPVLLTEGGLHCFRVGENECPSDRMRNSQANYVIRLYSRVLSAGLLGATWYTLTGPGYRESGLLDNAQNPRPAYTSLKFFSLLLQDARFNTKLSTTQYEGYEFQRGNTRYQVYWSNLDASIPITLPNGTIKVYNKFGEDITPGNRIATISFEPIILEIGQ